VLNNPGVTPAATWSQNAEFNDSGRRQVYHNSMPSVASAVPEESHLLCEGCGYIVSGLPSNSRCPECALPIEQSLPEHRQPPAWEQIHGYATLSGRFLATTREIIFRPARFYRLSTTRTGSDASRRFAQIHHAITALLFGLAALLQLWWLRGWPTSRLRLISWEALAAFVMLSLLTYVSLKAITRLAAWLTAWEAAYRGLRLPYQVVLRGLDYHSAHYLPVALTAAATVGGYHSMIMLGWMSDLAAPRYLYILCTEVIFAAAYLFSTYWKGMRNMMFANR